MLAVNQKTVSLKEVKASPNPINKDIFVERLSFKVEYNEEGVKTETPIREKINLTKKINETAKILNEDSVQERIRKLEEITGKGE